MTGSEGIALPEAITRPHTQLNLDHPVNAPVLTCAFHHSSTNTHYLLIGIANKPHLTITIFLKSFRNENSARELK